jgi:hypothetical protein
MHEMNVRHMPDRKLVTTSRYLHIDEADSYFDVAYARLRALAPGVEGIVGAPFLVFHGEISADSDGPSRSAAPSPWRPAAMWSRTRRRWSGSRSGLTTRPISDSLRANCPRRPSCRSVKRYWVG